LPPVLFTRDGEGIAGSAESEGVEILFEGTFPAERQCGRALHLRVEDTVFFIVQGGLNRINPVLGGGSVVGPISSRVVHLRFAVCCGWGESNTARIIIAVRNGLRAQGRGHIQKNECYCGFD